MKVNDGINNLFHNRLHNTEMPVQEGFWEKLESDLVKTDASEVIQEKRKRFILTSRFTRLIAAASVVLVLGIASAAFWYFSPKDEIKEAFTQVAVLTPQANLKGDVIQETFPPVHETVSSKPDSKHKTGGGLTAFSDDGGSDSISVRVSITITQHVYGDRKRVGNSFLGDSPGESGEGSRVATDYTEVNSGVNSSSPDGETNGILLKGRSSKWALKAAIGSSLPKSDYNMPLTAELSVERSLNKCLSVEAGIRYSRLHGNSTLHTLGIPLKLNMILTSVSKVDIYAMAGGAAEKCIAGAGNNGFKAEPVQLSVIAGVGIRYKLSDRFALFAEPTVSHHFDTDSATKTLYTERPTNMNLLCGIRMTY